MSAYQTENGALSSRPIDSDHTLIFCRLIGLSNPDLKQFWPDRSGKLTIHFGQITSSDNAADKVFNTRLRAQLFRGNQRIQSLLNIELAAPINVLVANSPKDAMSLKQTHTTRKINNFNAKVNDICSSHRNFSGHALPNALLFCRSENATIGADIDALWLQFNIAHELLHAYQFQLAGATKTTTNAGTLKHDGPLWLAEGSAQVIANHLTTGLPLGEYSDRMLAKQDGRFPSLTRLDDRSDLKARKTEIYRAGVVAIAMLIPDENYAKLGEFYTELGQVDDWETAFQTVFGTTVDDFYTAFDNRFQ